MPQEVVIWSRDTLQVEMPRQAALVEARKAINLSPELTALFDDAYANQWSTETLTKRLCQALPDTLQETSVPEVAVVARYLAEEFAARDKGLMLIVSSETGVAAGQVPLDAIEPVGEGTGLIKLKPDIEAAFTLHQFEAEREMHAVSLLAERIRSTAILNEHGDLRLRVGYRKGRAAILEQVRTELLRDATTREVQGVCRMVDAFPEDCTAGVELDVNAYVTALVSDVRALNLSFATAQHLYQSIQVQWVRHIVRLVAARVHRDWPKESVSIRDELGDGILVASPDSVFGYVGEGAKRVGVPVLDAAGLFVTSGAHLYARLEPSSLICQSHDSGGFWSVDATGSFTVYWNPEKIRAVTFSDLDECAIVAEVVA